MLDLSQAREPKLAPAGEDEKLTPPDADERLARRRGRGRRGEDGVLRETSEVGVGHRVRKARVADEREDTEARAVDEARVVKPSGLSYWSD